MTPPRVISVHFPKAGGQRNAPSSSCFQYKIRPKPSQAKIFNRSARFERKTRIFPENKSR